ncbi:hypothetical protein LIER_09498 [Lithospermum erythrorhizon]|uniref:Uncharacterized protein n=1 Tax=Lithospermum erythrorhizon TaxID=34254 RepID=A0AAV3PHI2_LITER
MQAPTLDYWQAVKRILRYRIDQGLLLQPSTSFDLLSYTDSDWAGFPTARRSLADYFKFNMFLPLIRMQMCSQKALSTTRFLMLKSKLNVVSPPFN